MLLNIPALPETTDCHPTPGSTPSLPPHPQSNTRWAANLACAAQEGWGVEGEMQGGMILLLGRHSKGQAWSPGLSYTGAAGKAKKSLSHPQPWPTGSSSTNHNTLPRPSPLPPK